VARVALVLAARAPLAAAAPEVQVEGLALATPVQRMAWPRAASAAAQVEAVAWAAAAVVPTAEETRFRPMRAVSRAQEIRARPTRATSLAEEIRARPMRAAPAEEKIRACPTRAARCDSATRVATAIWARLPQTAPGCPSPCSAPCSCGACAGIDPALSGGWGFPDRLWLLSSCLPPARKTIRATTLVLSPPMGHWALCLRANSPVGPALTLPCRLVRPRVTCSRPPLTRLARYWSCSADCPA
jgi:hypothetical protein